METDKVKIKLPGYTPIAGEKKQNKRQPRNLDVGRLYSPPPPLFHRCFIDPIHHLSEPHWKVQRVTPPSPPFLLLAFNIHIEQCLTRRHAFSSAEEIENFCENSKRKKNNRILPCFFHDFLEIVSCMWRSKPSVSIRQPDPFLHVLTGLCVCLCVIGWPKKCCVYGYLYTEIHLQRVHTFVQWYIVLLVCVLYKNLTWKIYKVINSPILLLISRE